MAYIAATDELTSAAFADAVLAVVALALHHAATEQAAQAAADLAEEAG
ncbi:hypothetical protein [Kitasatospora sp. NPDC088783]